MFIKKKPPLPARPAIPDKDEILQDLRESTDDDIVFKPLPIAIKAQESIVDGESCKEVATEDLNFEKLTLNQPLDSSKGFEIAKSFLNKCNSLENALKDIDEKQKSLSAMKISLEEDIKNVKDALGEKHRSKGSID